AAREGARRVPRRVRHDGRAVRGADARPDREGAAPSGRPRRPGVLGAGDRFPLFRRRGADLGGRPAPLPLRRERGRGLASHFELLRGVWPRVIDPVPATLVLFAVDGTLVNTAGAGRRGLEHAFREVFDLREIAEPASRVRFEGKSDPAIIAEIAREAGVDGAIVERRSPELPRAYLDGLRRELGRPDPRRRVLPGVSPLLELLDRREDAFLGLVTGNIEEGARAKLQAFDLNRYFPDGGFASDHPDRAEIA